MESKNHGGARANAGRKKKEVETMLKSVRMPARAWKWRDSLAKALNKPKGEVIEDALQALAKAKKISLD